MLHVSPAPEKFFPLAMFWDSKIMVYSKNLLFSLLRNPM